MIANELIKSFYIIEVEGDALENVFGDTYDIQKIVMGSKDFVSDLEATSAMRGVVEFLTLGLKLDDVKETISFNPEFFPSLENAKLTESQKMEMLEYELEEGKMNEKLQEQNKMAIAITKVFDPLGDYVTSRWELESPDMKIVAKIGINPDKYLQYKVSERLDSQSSLLKFNSRPDMVMH